MKKERKESDRPAADLLSAEEIAMLRAETMREERDRSKIPPPENPKTPRPIRYAKKNTASVVTFLIAAVAFILVVALLLALLVGSSCQNRSDYVVTMIKGKEKKKMTYRYEDWVIDGELYLDMNTLADFTGMTRSGTEERMAFIASPTQFLEFENKSEFAVINGTRVLIPKPVLIENKICKVPYSLLAVILQNGLSFRIDTAKNTLEITYLSFMEEDVQKFESIEFTTGDLDLPITSPTTKPPKPYEYSIDVSGYMQYIDPADVTPYLILANRTHPITEDPQNLVDIPAKWTGISSEYKDYKMDAGAAQALIAMMTAMREAGIKDAYVTSSYRSYARQEALFNQYVAEEMAEHGCSREEAELLALEYSARPGTSEHQTGLCVDFMTSAMKELNNSFENTAAFRWLAENAHYYGFILRYPDHKTDIVGYSYESWHYRFVGKTVAVYIHDNDLTLEEYLESRE